MARTHAESLSTVAVQNPRGTATSQTEFGHAVCDNVVNVRRRGRRQSSRSQRDAEYTSVLSTVFGDSCALGQRRQHTV